MMWVYRRMIPSVLLKIILLAYSRGIATSREIEWYCNTNIIFKALSCDTVPHYTTIASFVSGHPQEIAELFEQVLLICQEQGLLGNELFAIEGSKMPSDASKEWSGTFKELAQKRDKIKRQIQRHLNEHQRLDKYETRDDARLKRAKQAIETLDKANDKIDRFLKCNSPRKGQEHHTLQPISEAIKDRYERLEISEDIYQTGVIVTADTGFANEANMLYLHENNINGYFPDNQFRSIDPKFADQKTKYGKRHQKKRKQSKPTQFIPASEFRFDPVAMTCICPAGSGDCTVWFITSRRSWVTGK